MIHHMEMGHAYILGAERQTRGREVQWLPSMPLCRAVDQRSLAWSFLGGFPHRCLCTLVWMEEHVVTWQEIKPGLKSEGLPHTQVPRGNFLTFISLNILVRKNSGVMIVLPGLWDY